MFRRANWEAAENESSQGSYPWIKVRHLDYYVPFFPKDAKQILQKFIGKSYSQIRLSLVLTGMQGIQQEFFHILTEDQMVGALQPLPSNRDCNIPMEQSNIFWEGKIVNAFENG